MCLTDSPSIENCSFTLHRGDAVTSEAARDSVVPSAYVRVMFVFGKSCSVISNTWTPTPTWPVLVSVHVAWEDRRRLQHFGYWSYFLTSIVIISVQVKCNKPSVKCKETQLDRRWRHTVNVTHVNMHNESSTINITVWLLGVELMICCNVFLQIVIDYLIQSKVWGNCSFWCKLASDVISVRIVCQKTKSGETVLRHSAWKHTNIWIKYKQISSCICCKFNRNLEHINIWCNVPPQHNLIGNAS